MKRNGAINEMAYPATFDMKRFKSLKTFRDRTNYCLSELKYLGMGSARMVFEVDDEKVLKLAYNKKGLAQNEAEADWFLPSYGIFAEVYDMHPSYQWIEMEKAAPARIADFDRIYTGENGLFGGFFEDWAEDMGEDYSRRGMFDWLHAYVYHAYLVSKGWNKGEAWEDVFAAFENTDEYPGSLFDGLSRYIRDYDLHAYGDLQRISSYGLVRRDGGERIVLIDYGLNNSIYDQYYKRRRQQK